MTFQRLLKKSLLVCTGQSDCDCVEDSDLACRGTEVFFVVSFKPSVQRRLPLMQRVLSGKGLIRVHFIYYCYVENEII